MAVVIQNQGVKEMTDAIAIFGGTRRDGNTGTLLDWVGRALDIDIIDLADKQMISWMWKN
jgi:hypothetical protein